MARKVKPKRKPNDTKTSPPSYSRFKGWRHSTLESELEAIGLRINTVRGATVLPQSADLPTRWKGVIEVPFVHTGALQDPARCPTAPSILCRRRASAGLRVHASAVHEQGHGATRHIQDSCRGPRILSSFHRCLDRPLHVCDRPCCLKPRGNAGVLHFLSHSSKHSHQ